MSTDGPTLLELHAIEVLKVPDGWRWFRFERLPKDARESTHIQITGAVCTEVFTRGPRKGHKNWSKRDLSTERQVVFSDAEHEKWCEQWEVKTGKCRACAGTGLDWCGWSAKEGNRYRDCRRCNATGKAPSATPVTPTHLTDWKP